MEDEKLIAILDDRFGQIRVYIDGRFATVDARFDAMQQQMDTRFNAMQQKMDDRFNQVENDIREVREDVKAVADGYITVEAKLDRFAKETAENFADVRDEMRFAFTHREKRVSALEKRRRK